MNGIWCKCMSIFCLDIWTIIALSALSVQWLSRWFSIHECHRTVFRFWTFRRENVIEHIYIFNRSSAFTIPIKEVMRWRDWEHAPQQALGTQWTVVHHYTGSIHVTGSIWHDYIFSIFHAHHVEDTDKWLWNDSVNYFFLHLLRLCFSSIVHVCLLEYVFVAECKNPTAGLYRQIYAWDIE